MGDWFGVDLTDYFDPGGDDYSPPTPVDHWSELLLQPTWWHDPDGSIWRLDEMDEMRCSRIYGFIARHEDETGTRLAWEATRGPAPGGDVAFDAYDRGLGQLLDMVSERGWIHRTELMQALQRRMWGLPSVEGTCFCGYPVAEGWEHSACRAGMEIA
ncbi:hypothetical protein ACFW5V_32315 [Streptomyces sp. NPDC058762]|uniref:hypothetical protein n=1 Tax=Streptomyces sp. NPDC058762 TaxID=3346629 RepID=UPI00367AD630